MSEKGRDKDKVKQNEIITPTVYIKLKQQLHLYLIWKSTILCL